MSGSAFPATSGTPRPDAPAGPEADAGARLPSWQGNWALTPPPPAPPPLPSFHTVSAEITPVAGSACRLVPPQPSACGLDAGKSTCGWPSVTPSPLPLSPDATQTVTPSATASAMAWSSAVMDWVVQELSGPPQLMLMAAGVGCACAAFVTASRKPWSVLGAK